MREPRALGEPLRAAVALDPEVGALRVWIRVLLLREDAPPAGQRRRGVVRVANSDGPHATAGRGHLPQRRHRFGVGARPEDRTVVNPARTHGEPSAGHERRPGRELLRRALRRSLHRIGPGGERTLECHAERRLGVGVENERNELQGALVDELAQRLRAAGRGGSANQRRAEGVREVAQRVERRCRGERIRARHCAAKRMRARDGWKVGAHGAAGAGELRLVVHRDAFRHPARRVGVRKEERVAAEHELPGAPQATRAVEMEDVRQLVRDHQIHPVVDELQRVRVDGRTRVDHDPVRRKERRVAVRRVVVVPDHDVHDAARWMEFLRQGLVRPLGRACGPTRRGFEAVRVGHAEVRRRDGLPVQVGGELRIRSVRRRPDEQRGGQCKSHGVRFGASPRKYPSSPSRIPRAYRDWNSAVRNAASCSGTITNAPSHRIDGIHVGRASARLS